ncbi:MAG: hypothetical protein CMJ31_10530 [Phycisphaerae bacterium]|nr:hypothetical protein [Phycisphaerae bacterium]
MRVPHVQPAEPLTEVDPSRFLASWSVEDPRGCQIGVIGLADDTGVAMNHGRPGAAGGPWALRQALRGYGVANPSTWKWPRVFDAGDVLAGDSLEETHDRVTEATAALIDAGLTPVAIGGGHDLTFPFVRAVAQSRPDPLVGVYFDAHLDVRDAEGSGMPFRRLVDRCGVTELHVHGLDPNANTAEHTNWFAAHGGRVDPFEPEDKWPEGDLFVSFDLDVIDAAYAPGVSAMNPAGWAPRTAARWVYAAGQCERVRCFDIMELAPTLDPSGRSSRLAARLLLEFMRGFAERNPS